MLKRIAIAGALLAALALAVACTSSGGPKKLTLTPKATVSAAPTASASPLPCGGPCTPPSPGRHTVTYIVTGSPAHVTYGPSGSTFAATGPLHVTGPLRHPRFYSVQAHLQGPGRVTCKIQVDGRTIAARTARGAHGIAQCSITRDPFTGAWADASRFP